MATPQDADVLTRLRMMELLNVYSTTRRLTLDDQEAIRRVSFSLSTRFLTGFLVGGVGSAYVFSRIIPLQRLRTLAIATSSLTLASFSFMGLEKRFYSSVLGLNTPFGHDSREVWRYYNPNHPLSMKYPPSLFAGAEEAAAAAAMELETGMETDGYESVGMDNAAAEGDEAASKQRLPPLRLFNPENGKILEDAHAKALQHPRPPLTRMSPSDREAMQRANRRQRSIAPSSVEQQQQQQQQQQDNNGETTFVAATSSDSDYDANEDDPWMQKEKERQRRK